MPNITKLQISQNYIDKIIMFLTLHVKLSEGHMVDYLTNNLYSNCVPEGIKNEINQIGFSTAIKLILDESDGENVPELNNFISTAKSFSLYNMKDICWGYKEFIQSLDVDDSERLRMNVFMNSKKSHEVETMSILARNIAAKAHTSHLVDIGDGRGYLSSQIAYHHKIPVLGVDGSLMNTKSAIKRAEKLQKHWGHASGTGTPRKKGEKRTTAPDSKHEYYKQITKLVTEETDFGELVANVFLQQPAGIGLIGLHTCGNLGPTCVRIFNTNANIRTICNVACCYHLLNEDYLANAALGSIRETHPGYPMSAHVRRSTFTMRRSVRMLASQTLDRILERKELPSKIIFYRALFETLLEEDVRLDKFGNRKQVGRFRAQPACFGEYAREAAQRLHTVLTDSDEALAALYAEYLPRRDELNVFHLLRSMLAPAIEALILLDRYTYLLEEGHDDVHLVQLFDPVISPRCYGLIAMKH